GRLREELAKLGLTRCDETASLYRELSRGDPVNVPTRTGAPMVGRDRQLVIARKALETAALGRGGALVILGDAGIGKTRLADALLDDAEARGWHTLRGAGREDEGRPPYGPIVEAIDPLVAARPDLLESLAEPLQRVLALLLPSVPATEAASPADAERHQVFAGVAQLVLAAARERGAVVVLEDLHASDTATLGLARYLVRAAGRAP